MDEAVRRRRIKVPIAPACSSSQGRLGLGRSWPAPACKRSQDPSVYHPSASWLPCFLAVVPLPTYPPMRGLRMYLRCAAIYLSAINMALLEAPVAARDFRDLAADLLQSSDQIARRRCRPASCQGQPMAARPRSRLRPLPHFFAVSV